MNIFKGVNGRNMEEVESAKQLFGNPSIFHELSNGQIGCMFSHFKLWKHIIDNNIEIAIIFEDDVHFHPDWSKISPIYFSETPNDFDVIFIGNQIGNYNTSLVTNQACYCTHAYVVTLNGAKHLLDSCLNWRSDLFYHPVYKIEGLYAIDIIIKHTQNLINQKKIEQKFIWYCWNGTKYPCVHNMLPLENLRNSGLVFQAFEIFGSSTSTLKT
jgi:GR25 family glycosyltransferase involved in LPS biosynthesis